jgi:hypothetical protein
MKILLHDGYNRRGLGEPVTLTIAAITAAISKANQYVNANLGGWSGLNQKILSIIGRNPATDPKAIEALRKGFYTPGDPHYNTETGAAMRAISNGTITNESLILLSQKLPGMISTAKAGAEKNDWAAARYFVVYGEFLKIAKTELEKRGKNYTEAPKSGAEYAPAPGTTAKSLIIPAAIILGLKFIL